MIDAFFAAFGNLFATGVGILLLAVITGAIYVLWDWRIALLGTVLVHFGSSSILVLIHGVPGLVAAGQMIAVTISAAMLLFAGFVHPHGITLRQATNWLLRLMAIVFIAAAWWYLDPGYTLPSFSQPETDFLLWTGICGLALLSFSSSPLMGGAAVLLWSTPLYALAAVLLPGSGLPAIVGIANIVIALACSYLTLLEPSAVRNVPGSMLFKTVPPAAVQTATAQTAAKTAPHPEPPETPRTANGVRPPEQLQEKTVP
jgi:hypothetical protein